MDKKNMSDIARVNRLAVILYIITTVILTLAYTLQLVKGETSIGVFAALAVTGLGPAIACFIIRKINPETPVIKHIIAIGYATFYLISCMTSAEQQVYVYAIPMIIVVSLYNDVKFSTLIGVGVSILAIAHAVKFGLSQGFSNEAVAKMEIEIALMFMFTIYSSVINKLLASISGRKNDEVKEASEKTAALLENVMKVSKDLAEDVKQVSDKMMELGASSEETLASMHEVQEGTAETADSIQAQLEKTEEIHGEVVKVTEASTTISENVSVTVEAVREGRGYINKLMDQAKISDEEGKDVITQVTELKEATNQMTQIVDLIKSVASQTSLLALNASIEAARAGEAGRGFSVVATEISGLAAQTQTATGSISSLIENIATEIEQVVEAINKLVESNKIQNESAKVSQESFEKIAESIRQIRTSSEELTEVVGSLGTANQQIVEGIQTISAVTEEVTAHATTTREATEHNQSVVESVQEIVEAMNESASLLSNM